MEPFVYDQPRRPWKGWLLMASAAAVLLLWQFDLLPTLAPVSNQAAAPSESASTPGFNDTESRLLPDRIISHPAAPESASVEQFPEPIAADSVFTDFTEPPLSSNNRPVTRAAGSPEAAAEDQGVSRAVYERPSTETPEESLSGRVSVASWEQPTGPAEPRIPGPARLDAETAAIVRAADRLIEADDILRAHDSLSRLYWEHPECRPFIAERLSRTSWTIYADPNRHFAEPHFTEYGETLASIAEKYKVPWPYLGRLNRTEPKQLQAGVRLKVVTGPFDAVVSLSDFRLTVHAHGWYVNHYTIGIGRENRTPLGEFTVQEKLENPTWFNPAGGIIDGDDPANPLGEYWIGLGNHIGIHGTINPDSIGSAQSLGCIHLRDDDIAEVFQLLGSGSTVIIKE